MTVSTPAPGELTTCLPRPRSRLRLCTSLTCPDTIFRAAAPRPQASPSTSCPTPMATVKRLDPATPPRLLCCPTQSAGNLSSAPHSHGAPQGQGLRTGCILHWIPRTVSAPSPPPPAYIMAPCPPPPVLTCSASPGVSSPQIIIHITPPHPMERQVCSQTIQIQDFMATGKHKWIDERLYLSYQYPLSEWNSKSLKRQCYAINSIIAIPSIFNN